MAKKNQLFSIGIIIITRLFFAILKHRLRVVRYTCFKFNARQKRQTAKPNRRSKVFSDDWFSSGWRRVHTRALWYLLRPCDNYATFLQRSREKGWKEEMTNHWFIFYCVENALCRQVDVKGLEEKKYNIVIWNTEEKKKYTELNAFIKFESQTEIKNGISTGAKTDK